MLESDIYKHQLMWDPNHQSWRLVFLCCLQCAQALLLSSMWRTLKTPKWQDFFKDLRMRKPDTETMHIQIHATDLAELPFAGELKWLIEGPPAWRWFLTWAPGMIPCHFIDYNIWPVPPSLSSSPLGIPSFGPPPSSGSTLTTAPSVQPASLTHSSSMPSQQSAPPFPPLERFLSEDTGQQSVSPSMAGRNLRAALRQACGVHRKDISPLHLQCTQRNVDAARDAQPKDDDTLDDADFDEYWGIEIEDLHSASSSL